MNFPKQLPIKESLRKYSTKSYDWCTSYNLFIVYYWPASTTNPT